MYKVQSSVFSDVLCRIRVHITEGTRRFLPPSVKFHSQPCRTERHIRAKNLQNLNNFAVFLSFFAGTICPPCKNRQKFPLSHAKLQQSDENEFGVLTTPPQMRFNKNVSLNELVILSDYIGTDI